MDREITQPLINIGLLGHVANGKSSLVRSITGEKTARNDSRCMQKGESREMTIQIGYSNAKIYQCGHCPKPDCYTSIEGSKKEIPACACGAAEAMKLVQFVSFVDCFYPNTEVLMLDGESRQIRDVGVGDLVTGDDGQGRQVLQVQSGRNVLFRVRYTGGEFMCTGGHILVLRIENPVYTGANYSVSYYSTDDSCGLHLKVYLADSEKDAQEFYDTLDKSPIIFETTVFHYLRLSDVLPNDCRLFRADGTSFSFEIEDAGIGDYVGIHIDGNGRFLLADGLVVHNCPGHRMLMRNMISGSAVMDGAILVVDANNKNVPQVQTLEHLTAAEIVGINHYVLVAQNKIDLLLNDPSCKKRLLKNQQQIEEFVKDTGADLSRTPLIPTCVSPARQINLPLILQYLVERAKPNPHPAYARYPMFIHCVRSFDINKPCPAIGLKGGVLGGTIMHGVLRIGDTLEIRPGYKTEAGEYCPLYTKVTSLYTGTVPLQEARPGGLIGIGTTLDPALTRSDAMVGMCAGYPEQLPPAMTRLELKLYMLTHGIGHDQEVRSKVGRLHSGDVVQLAIGSATVPAKMLERITKIYQFETSIPVCPVPGQSIPISKIVDGAWTIIGKAQLAGYTDTKTPPPVTIEFEPYHDLLERTLRDAEPVDLGGKLIVPPPQLAKDGGARLVWTNYRETCAALKREETHLSAFFTEELATSVTINSIQQMVIHGKNRYQSSHIQSILVKYITGYVNCPTCRSAHTTLNRDPGSKYTRMLCRRCGAEHLR